MSSPMLYTTLQAAALAGLSNILAQAITMYQNHKPFSIDTTPLIQFVTWALISTPPNIYWQEFLEEKFPTSKVDKQGQKRVSKSNTAKKFLLDQTVGATLNTGAFIAGMSAFKGRDLDGTMFAIQQDFWPMISSGWTLWPAVSLLNFTVMPADKRILFGNIVGLFWGIYISLLVG